MTEAGKQWVKTVAAAEGWDAYAPCAPDYAASVFIGAFCEEVERRALIAAEANGHVTSSYIERGGAFDALKRELIGE